MVKRRISLLVFLLISLLISCSTAVAGDKQKTEELSVEVHASDRVIFKNVRIINDRGVVLVEGALRPLRQIPPKNYGHVDIELFDIKGSIVEKVQVKHRPGFRPNKIYRLSYFTFSLGEYVQRTNKVRVSYHHTPNDNKSVCNQDY